ncbi:MAG: hypothetical protein R3E13_05135 [Alphaproteobacteria bacterium]
MPLKSFNISIFSFAIFVLFSFAAAAQGGGLTNENVRAYYEYLEDTNTIYKEGREDLGTWLSFLDESFADDYAYKSRFYDLCVDEPEVPPPVDKAAILDIYQTIGIRNYDDFRVEVLSVDIAEDAMSAQVGYSIDLGLANGAVDFAMHLDCEAEHVWDAQKGKAQVREQRCDERILKQNGRKACD